MQPGDPLYLNKAQYENRLATVKGARAEFLSEMVNMAKLHRGIETFGDTAGYESYVETLARHHSGGVFGVNQTDQELVEYRDGNRLLEVSERNQGLFRRTFGEVDRMAKQGMQNLIEAAGVAFAGFATVATGGAAGGALGASIGLGAAAGGKQLYDDVRNTVEKNRNETRERVEGQAAAARRAPYESRERLEAWGKAFNREAQEAKATAPKAGAPGRLVIPAMAKIESLAVASGEGRI